MDNAKVLLFTSPTCPHCPSAKQLLEKINNEREDMDISIFSLSSEEGSIKANEFGVIRVPTFIIQGPNHPEIIGLLGGQSEEVLNKYVDMALGKQKKEKKGFFTRLFS